MPEAELVTIRFFSVFTSFFQLDICTQGLIQQTNLCKKTFDNKVGDFVSVLECEWPKFQKKVFFRV